MGIDGNIIVRFDKNKEDLKHLITRIVESLSQTDKNIKSIVIKYMVELK